MKLVLAVLVAVFAFARLETAGAQPATCSEAYSLCLIPRAGPCDADCHRYCQAERRSCLQTGAFKTRNNSWSGLGRF